jgi:hypothetical protein
VQTCGALENPGKKNSAWTAPQGCCPPRWRGAETAVGTNPGGPTILSSTEPIVIQPTPGTCQGRATSGSAPSRPQVARPDRTANRSPNHRLLNHWRRTNRLSIIRSIPRAGWFLLPKPEPVEYSLLTAPRPPRGAAEGTRLPVFRYVFVQNSTKDNSIRLLGGCNRKYAFCAFLCLAAPASAGLAGRNGSDPPKGTVKAERGGLKGRRHSVMLKHY